jgi:dihydroneopterin aldolase
VTDSIRIDELKVQTRVGVSDEERSAPRPVLINVGLITDSRAAGNTDDLRDTIDYGRVIRRMSDTVGSREWRLIEHIAEEVARLLLREYGAKSVNIEIIKEVPPVDEDVRAVSVNIERAP